MSTGTLRGRRGRPSAVESHRANIEHPARTEASQPRAGFLCCPGSILRHGMRSDLHTVHGGAGVRGGESCIVSAHRCFTLRSFCRWHCLGRWRVCRAARRVVPRLRAPAWPARDCRICTRSGQCRRTSPEDIQRPSGSPPPPGRVSSVPARPGVRTRRIRASTDRWRRAGPRGAMPGRRAPRWSRRAFYGPTGQCEASIRFCLEWSHEMLKY